jgi:Xaa-Pro aminopeptidase
MFNSSFANMHNDYPNTNYEECWEKNYEKLEKGMIITIEPGLYKVNNLGVRIEDDVLITHDSCESLTKFNRDLRII